ncbi:MAG: radical SAM protein [Actinomycetota bacterium]|nr:radical SAM protein [Actinomycetota bacterium]
MRWDELKVDEEERRALPGYKEPAAVRTFDAPEALDTRFYEVRAKSVLNRVPPKSRMPFEWTVNPYRGCSHACLYCGWAETPVLMGDGRTKRLADIRIGDYVYGTVRKGAYRRYSISQVRAHWSTIKPAFRVTLEDGTELIASGDHRFLTERGWKHVSDTHGCPRRAHLTVNNKLLGTGQFAQAAEDWPDYRRGYLCGLIRGDGHLSNRPYQTPQGERRRINQFRLALTDLEALRRAKQYLEEDRNVVTQEFAFPTMGRRSMRAIRTARRDNVVAIQELIAWPRSPRHEWCKGFLAGIFDAEGSFSDSLRISNTDHEIIDWICSSLRRLGFPFVVEDRRLPNGLRCVRIPGGLQQHLRFFHTVDPAISRKRDIEGMALKSSSKLGVVSIEPLRGSHRLYDITTGTGDFIADGVVSHNCFARPTHTYLGLDAGRDFEREIVVKVNAPEVLRAELRRPSWKRRHVAMGTNTDPYQWVESKYRLMPGIWQALIDSGTPGSILTKSPLLLRDLDLMKQVPGIRANLSIPTMEQKAWRATEPHTPSPMRRMEAVAELNRAGIPCGILIAPLMPGINDSPEQVARIIELAGEAGAVDIGGIALHLRGEVKGLFFDWLRENRPELLSTYERLYARGAYAPAKERQRLARLASPPGRPRRALRGIGGSAASERVPAQPGEEADARGRQETLF